MDDLMERIASFTVDHNKLLPGMYLSRMDGDIATYDLRFVKPNTPPFLEIPAVHTIEHLFATFVRNSPLKDGVIYFGPMGCRTGFYFLVREPQIAPADAIRLAQEALLFIADYAGEIPGTTATECGNYREHDLSRAREYAREMAAVLSGWQPENLVYMA